MIALRELEDIAKGLARHRSFLHDDTEGTESYLAGVLDVIEEMRGRGHVEVEMRGVHGGDGGDRTRDLSVMSGAL